MSDTYEMGLRIKDYGRQIPGDEARVRANLEHDYPGNVYDTTEVQERFTITGFAAPFVECVRKADGVRGSLEFTHSPRLYFNFIPER